MGSAPSKGTEASAAQGGSQAASVAENSSKERRNSNRQKSVKVDNDEKVFREACLKILKQVCANQADDWNDWVRIGSDAKGREVYMNKRTGRIQHQRPENFNEQRIEERVFEYVTLAEGLEVTTYVEEDGRRYYMDWDEGQWEPFPEEWLYALSEQDVATHVESTAATPNQSSSPQADDRLFELSHPAHGEFFCYLLEHPRNYYLVLDSNTQEWIRMPLEWERLVPEVKAKLKQLSDLFPQWTNWREQLMYTIPLVVIAPRTRILEGKTYISPAKPPRSLM
ncbi:uncharacterized protein MONBRDRAFT_13076, partial [Monosiga brevicollis MX1]